MPLIHKTIHHSYIKVYTTYTQKYTLFIHKDIHYSYTKV